MFENWYAICDNDWLFDKRIKNELNLLLYISSLTAEKWYCYAGNQHFAEKFEVDEVTISRKLWILEKLSFIKMDYERRWAEIINRKIRLTKMLIDEQQNNYSTVNKNVNRRLTKMLKRILQVINITSINNIETSNFSEESFEYKICEKFLHFHIRRLTPSVLHLLKTKERKQVIQDWCIECEKLKRIDLYSEQQIEFVINFIQEDDFWSNQILTFHKLRKKNREQIPYFVVMVDKIKEMKESLLRKWKKWEQKISADKTYEASNSLKW